MKPGKGMVAIKAERESNGYADVGEDKRLIEDYLPIQALSVESSREKSVRKGHISTLHLWWARRPLVACRAAVYAVLVPASRFVWSKDSKNSLASNAEGLGRKEAEKFVERLCKYPGDRAIISEAEEHILEAHAERLSKETGKKVVLQDILEDRVPRPKVLDMFSGGGAIPLEALRLGCDTYAVELNPVAHIIELCTLVYPQRFGRADETSLGTTGPSNTKGESTWGGLSEEVRYWGNWVLEHVKAEIGDLYPVLPEPGLDSVEMGFEARPGLFSDIHNQQTLKAGGEDLTPVAYLWTRTVRCKKQSCSPAVPLVRQTWLKKEGKKIAARMLIEQRQKVTRFEVVEAPDEESLGFDPSSLSSGGAAACPFCGTVADLDYVKSEGMAGRLGHQLFAIVCKSGRGRGKLYLNPEKLLDVELFKPDLIDRADNIAQKLDISVPSEPLEANPRSFDVQHFGFRKWRDLFTPRQLIAMTAFAGTVKAAHRSMLESSYEPRHAIAVATCLSMALGRLADYSTSFCTWQPEFIKDTFNSPGLPMVMDFAETNPLANSSGGWPSAISYVLAALQHFAWAPDRATVLRSSAFSSSLPSESFDAVVTDPPYYDSRSYSNLSDHFYVWHKQSIGHLYPEHFSSVLTPKKNEAIAAPYRHGGSREAADDSYEKLMHQAFREAGRLLKPGMPLVCVYAHKTTAGWATLIDSLRSAGFMVVEAWPVQMERKVRQNARETGALSSSILLTARKRNHEQVGSYEATVRPELERIVRERVESLWKMGISGADLVIAAVGAGLRAFTLFASVEYANGEEVPAELFLKEVEGVVLETLLEKIFGYSSSKVASVDGPSRFYVLWRYAYKAAELDAGEAILFAYPQSVELDGPGSLTQGKWALVEKKKNKYLLRDFTGRGVHEDLGLSEEDAANGGPPLIDVLHRILWLMENEPRKINDYLEQAAPDRERLRQLAQALAGPVLRGGEFDGKLINTTSAEASALGKLLANWRTLIDARLEEFRLR
jgi:putative DNA methylase